MSTADRSNNTALWAIVGLLALILVAGVGGGAMFFAGQRADRAKLEQKEADAKAAEKQRRNDDIDAGELKRIKLFEADFKANVESLTKTGGKNLDHPVMREARETLAENAALRSKILAAHPGWTEDGPPR